MEGQTDMTKQTVAFRNFANAPENYVSAQFYAVGGPQSGCMLHDNTDMPISLFQPSKEVRESIRVPVGNVQCSSGLIQRGLLSWSYSVYEVNLVPARPWVAAAVELKPPSSELLRDVSWFKNDVSGLPIRSNFKGQTVREERQLGP